MAIAIFQRGMTTKLYRQELQFLCSAHHLMMLYISIRFHYRNQWKGWMLLTLMYCLRIDLLSDSFLAFSCVRSSHLKINIFSILSHPRVYSHLVGIMNIYARATFELHKCALINERLVFYVLKTNQKSRHCYAKFT